MVGEFNVVSSDPKKLSRYKECGVNYLHDKYRSMIANLSLFFTYGREFVLISPKLSKNIVLQKFPHFSPFKCTTNLRGRSNIQHFLDSQRTSKNPRLLTKNFFMGLKNFESHYTCLSWIKALQANLALVGSATQ